jgi:transcriptional regulator with PAS, ATPase and Fis domain
MEKLLIREALHRHKGNRTKAAGQLGINPSTLYRKMKALDINAGDKDS